VVELELHGEEEDASPIVNVAIYSIIGTTF